MNEQVVVALLDEHVLLVSGKQQWLSSVRHHYRFTLSTKAIKPLPSLSHRHSNLLNTCLSSVLLTHGAFLFLKNYSTSLEGIIFHIEMNGEGDGSYNLCFAWVLRHKRACIASWVPFRSKKRVEFISHAWLRIESVVSARGTPNSRANSAVSWSRSWMLINGAWLEKKVEIHNPYPMSDSWNFKGWVYSEKGFSTRWFVGRRKPAPFLNIVHSAEHNVSPFRLFFVWRLVSTSRVFHFFGKWVRWIPMGYSSLLTPSADSIVFLRGCLTSKRPRQYQSLL